MASDPLWERWKQVYAGRDESADLHFDGVADEREFRAARYRLLFVLKEPNVRKEGWKGADMREQLRHGVKYQIGNALGLWASGILNDFPPYEVASAAEKKNAALRSIAAINAKKVGGGSTSSAAIINGYAYRDRALLREQINMIDPQIVVACGTMEPVLWLLEPELAPSPDFGNPVVDRRTRRVLVPWRHPARSKNRESYDGLQKLLTLSHVRDALAS